jgi:predicted O-methyltransferase YrrM
LTSRGFTTGAEVGVQTGFHSEILLRNWKPCTRFYLIDLWAQQQNYAAVANVEDNVQQQYLQAAKTAVAAYQNKTTFLQMTSLEAAGQLPDHSLDFVYIDARHDYCGVKEDLNAYWPKLRPGGILAGHDFMNNEEVKIHAPQMDWGLCMDGSRNEGAVKAALHECADQKGLIVSVMYDEQARFPSWMTQKPTIPECVTVI